MRKTRSQRMTAFSLRWNLISWRKSNQALAGSKQTKHPLKLKEMLYWVRDFELVAHTLIRAAAESWHLISPSEFSKLYRRVCGHTMCSVARLRRLHEEVKYVGANHLPGDLVECGCARGAAHSNRNPDYHITELFTGSCLRQWEEVRELFRDQGVGGGVEFAEKFVSGYDSALSNRAHCPASR